MVERGTFYITTLGCPKNQADSRAMHTSLEEAGLRAVADPERAEYHLINSCAFIEPARVETVQTFLEAAALKETLPGQKLILAGCFAERYAGEIRRELPEADLSFGTGQYERAGELIAAHFFPSRKTEVAPTHPFTEGPERIPAFRGHYAAVKISDGCNRRCSFCAIPAIRGPFHSRDPKKIVKECESLVAAGVREIQLVSQDTIAYAPGVEQLLHLLERMHEIENLPWIRLLYLYPEPRLERLLRGIKERGLEKIVPYLETPLQHVSAKILKAMKRSGSYESYRDLLALARELFPDLEVRTSFLLGFPGEIPADVDLLLNFLHECRPEKLALFGFSPEDGTAAAGLSPPTSEDEMIDRINLVRNEHLEILKSIHLLRVGKVYPAMIDELTDEGIIAHRGQDAPGIDPVVFLEEAGNHMIGDILDVRITGFLEYDLMAVGNAI